MSKLLFKSKVDIDADTFVNIMNEQYESMTLWNVKFYLVLLFAGIGMLFFSYTIVLGIIILILSAAIFIFCKFIYPGTYSVLYAKYANLHSQQEYTITDDFFFIKTEDLAVKISWKYVYSVFVLSNWIIIGFAGSPTIYIPHDEMKKSEYYEEIINRLEKIKVKGKTIKKIDTTSLNKMKRRRRGRKRHSGNSEVMGNSGDATLNSQD